MTQQAVQGLSELAAAPTYNTPAASDTIPVAPSSWYIIHVKNTNAGALTVTLDDIASVAPAQASQFNADIVFTVPAATGERIVRFNSNRFRNSSGLMTVLFSVQSGVTYAIYGPF